jgi:hypothetical protein
MAMRHKATPDPLEKQIRRLHGLGMTVTEIDAAMQLARGTARRVMVSWWLRVKEGR